MQQSMPLATSTPRVITTTHDASGKAIFVSNEEVPLFQPMGPAGSSFAVFDARNAVPVDNTEAAVPSSNAIPRCPPNGAMFGVSNIAPHFTVPMHRTLSLDYAIVMNGEIVVALESGEERTVRAGEFIVQGGVSHSWHNRTDSAVRFAWVMLGADKVKLADGTELDAIVPGRP